MALYVDSAYLPDIKEVAAILPIAGVTTNPTILLAAQQRGQNLTPDKLLEELLREHIGSIFMQPGVTEEEEMYVQALAYIQVNPQRVIPKIPMTQSGMRVARRLSEQNHRIAFTAVTSVAQAYSAALLPAAYIIPYYSRMEQSGIDAAQRISEIADVLSNIQGNAGATRILTASIKTTQDAAAALLAGSDDLTITPKVLLDLLTDPLTDEAIERFTQDWQKMKKL